MRSKYLLKIHVKPINGLDPVNPNEAEENAYKKIINDDLTATISSISSYGEVRIKFNRNMLSPKNLTYINSTNEVLSIWVENQYNKGDYQIVNWTAKSFDND